jgi:hypothetical protein
MVKYYQLENNEKIMWLIICENIILLMCNDIY